MSSKPGIIDRREHGPLSEDEMMAVKNDPNALFASNENIMQFAQYYAKGKSDFVTQLKIKLQFQIEALQKQPETQYRNAYIDGLRRAVNLMD